MAQVQVGDDVSIGNERVGVEETQRGGLDGAAEIERAGFEHIGQVSDDHLADIAARGTVKDEAERAFGVVLADEHHGALEKRAAQLATVEEQLALQESVLFRHIVRPGSDGLMLAPQPIWIKFPACQSFVCC